ncbi:carboxypeptidase-like regulatory domain-containing protein [Verrucomicrobium spinosum]|uniref:carboxypeptidase-like regulatory domain-containing protein n=1 Tax=Verrucomicrobium spinosum TaxID=2736 RepID=UPI0002E2DBB6|nr:carboxypeptidase-like regulatory domain-containing protein [Verrucomicrobium spinosum]
MLRLRLISLVVVLSFVVKASAADITGTVILGTGSPVQSATVLIQSARMRTGDSTMCPTCWRDCQRSARTNAQGEFRISGVADDLVFDLLALAEHHAPAVLRGVDPHKKPVTLSLTARDLSRIPLPHQIRGQVLDPYGKPLAGATISPAYSRPEDDDQTLTNAHGHFVLCSSKPFERSQIKITAPGHAGTWISVAKRSENAADVTITLQRGATVIGRLLANGKPITNATVGVAQKNRNGGQFLGPISSTTDTEGRFAIHDVRANDDWEFYGEMESVKSLGFIPAQAFHSPAPDAIHDLGDVQIERALSLSGRLVRQDGEPFPRGTRIGLSRSRAWDGQSLDVSPDGSFTAHGLPSIEELTLSLPLNFYVISLPDGFSSNPSSNGLTFRLNESHSGLLFPITWKDHKTKQQDDLIASVHKEFFPFLEEAKLPDLQAEALLNILVARASEIQNAVATNPGAYLQSHSNSHKVHAPRLQALLGPALYQAFDNWELTQEGQSFGEAIAKYSGKEWMTSEEAHHVTLAMGRLQRWLLEFHANRSPSATLSPDQLASMLKWLQSESYEVTANLVSPAKHETLRKAIQALYEQVAQEPSE